MTFIGDGKWQNFYLSKLSFCPSHGLTKSSSSKTNPETNISTANLCKQKLNKSLIWNNELSAKVLLYNTRLKKFMHACPCMHMDHNSIKQEMSPKSKNIKSINAYALVMVVTYSSEFKFVNTPNSSSHFGSSKPCSSSWLNKETHKLLLLSRKGTLLAVKKG